MVVVGAHNKKAIKGGFSKINIYIVLYTFSLLWLSLCVCTFQQLNFMIAKDLLEKRGY